MLFQSIQFFQNLLVTDAVLWQVNLGDYITSHGFFNRPPFLLGIRISVDQSGFEIGMTKPLGYQ